MLEHHDNLCQGLGITQSHLRFWLHSGGRGSLPPEVAARLSLGSHHSGSEGSARTRKTDVGRKEYGERVGLVHGSRWGVGAAIGSDA